MVDARSWVRREAGRVSSPGGRRLGVGADSGAAGVHDQLARAARDGDTAALERLLELIDSDGSIRVPVRRVILNPATVEDVCQDVLILVAERLAQWDGRSRFTTWLYSVAHNRAIDQLRRTKPADALPQEVISDQRRISSMIATRMTVIGILQDLPVRYRDPVILRDIDQRAYDDIAAMLDLPPATVRTRVRRGRALIAARWAEATP